MQNRVDGNEFLETVRPVLEQADPERLAELAAEHWTADQLLPLLKHPSVDVRCSAALIVGLIGGTQHASPLAEALRDSEVCVSDMAEHGLWTLWFRACKPEAVASFHEGLSAMEAEDFDRAVDCFEETMRIDPTFAEAHNQCGIAHYFLGQWRHSIKHSDLAIKLMPTHFGAMAGAGHCYAQLEELPMALEYYRRSLEVNPNMPAIAGAVARLEKRRSKKTSNSGEFEVGEILRS